MRGGDHGWPSSMFFSDLYFSVIYYQNKKSKTKKATGGMKNLNVAQIYATQELR